MRSNPIRFTGMASGMDTDSIVRDLMRPQQYKIDQEKKAQALIKLKQDAWKDMNKKLYDFHTKFTDKMRLGSTFNKNETTSSNPDAISIDKDAIVPTGTHTFDVTQLAEATNVVGQLKGGEKVPANTKLSDLMSEADIPPKLSMKVNDIWVDIEVAKGDTLGQLTDKINTQLKDKKTGFTAKYDEKNGSLFISSTATGKEQTIAFSERVDKGKKLFDVLGLKQANVKDGQDAEYTYNGGGFASSTNKIEINGIKATLKSASLGKTVISAEPNSDAIYTWVKEFVTEYNNLLDDINEKLGTKPGKDIMPLTAEERESMSDGDIKLWEDKLNSSLFYRDDSLTQFVDAARKTLGQVFGGTAEDGYNSLASLGIVTGSWQEKGKLHILGDEDDSLYSGQTNKLKAALAKDPKAVTDLLTKVGKSLYDAHNDTFRASNKLKSAMNFYNDKTMNDQVKSFDKRILSLEERMYKMEETQYRKFAAMEKMLSSLNNQSSWLSQQFGGM